MPEQSPPAQVGQAGRPDVGTRLAAGTTGRVVVASTRNAWADFAAIYTPFTWTVGWLGRILAQVIFYALIGRLLGSQEQVRFLYIGAAVAATAMETLLVVATTARERASGTLPLLVASPSRLWPVFLGRSVQWIPSGVATASVALFVLGPLFGVSFMVGNGIVAFFVVVLVALTTYGYALALAALTLRYVQLRNWATNLSYTLMMMVCGVVVPLTFWPVWVQAIGQLFPLTHTLAAIRHLEDGTATAAEILTDIGLAVVTALVWYAIGCASLERLASSGRRDGSIEFAAD